MRRKDAPNSIPPPPEDVAVYGEPRLREWLNESFAACATDLTINTVGARLRRGLTWGFAGGGYRVFADPWPKMLHDALGRAVTDVRAGQGLAGDVQSNGGHVKKPNRCAMIPAGVSLFAWDSFIARNLPLIGVGVEVDSPYEAVQTGGGTWEVRGGSVSDDDDIVPLLPPPAASDGCPPTGSGATISLVLSGVNASICPPCGSVSPTTHYYTPSSISYDGTYSLAYTGESATTYNYLLAQSDPAAPAHAYINHGGDTSCASVLVQSFNNSIQVFVRKSDCRVTIVQSGATRNGAGDFVFRTVDTGGAGWGNGEPVPNLLVCNAGGFRIHADGGTATVTW